MSRPSGDLSEEALATRLASWPVRGAPALDFSLHLCQRSPQLPSPRGLGETLPRRTMDPRLARGPHAPLADSDGDRATFVVRIAVADGRHHPARSDPLAHGLARSGTGSVTRPRHRDFAGRTFLQFVSPGFHGW